MSIEQLLPAWWRGIVSTSVGLIEADYKFISDCEICYVTENAELHITGIADLKASKAL